jgi:pentatricopeptide repeat protein
VNNPRPGLTLNPQTTLAPPATVCIKAGELELALDVFQQLLREGCTPNLVTYNILIDVRMHKTP